MTSWSLGICFALVTLAVAPLALAAGPWTPSPRFPAPRSPVGAANDTCNTCLTLVSDVVSVLPNNATVTELIDAIAAVCDKLGLAPARCEALATELDSALISETSQGNWVPIACGAIGSCLYPCCLTESVPEGVHLSLTANYESEMVVTWSTLINASSTVRVGLTSGDYRWTFTGETFTYTAGGWLGTLHRALITGLPLAATRYYYICGDESLGWSQEFWFNTSAPVSDTTAGINVLVVGDMGETWESNVTRQLLAADAQSGVFHFLLHNGDMSYADGFQPIWDSYMREIQTIAAYVPYMTTPGNHEAEFSFDSYRARFAMPAATSNGDGPMFWSLDYRYLHLLGFATDYPPFDDDFAFAPDTPQFDWIVADLAKFANLTRPLLNEAGLPSVLLTAGHRPLYCSNDVNDQSDCFVNGPMFRGWIEQFFLDARVDIAFEAHEHSYERTWPVRDAVPEADYFEPAAPVYIMCGSAGNQELHDNAWATPSPVWSAWHNGTSYGYGRMYISPPTSTAATIHWEWVSDVVGEPVDSFVLTQRAA